MRFHRYWARSQATVHGSRSWQLTAYGSSDASIEAALARAQEVAERAARAIEQRGSFDNYGYGDRPIREEIVEEIHAHGTLAGVISRNSYGALVLNTSRAMFIDVDKPSAIDWTTPLASSQSLVDVLRSLFGRGSQPQPQPQSPSHESTTLDRFQQVIDTHPELGARVYRTAAGFRLLVTSATFDPQSSGTDQLLAAFGSDPLYTRMCKAQDCFRARLSAKFWRCGATRPPSRYPWQDQQQEARYREWEQKYHARANRFATCELVATLGAPTVDSAVQPILDVHDRLTLIDGAPLA